MSLLLLADTFTGTDLLSSVISATIAVVGTVGLFIQTVLKNNTFQNAVMQFFAKMLKKEIIDKTDIETHDIFIKLRNVSSNSFPFNFSSPSKAKLYKKYTELTASIFYSHLQDLLKKDLDTFTEGTLKVEVLTMVLSIYNTVDDKFFLHLKGLNNDEKTLSIIHNKIRDWRYETKSIVDNNISIVLSNGKYVSTEYKLDKVFDIISMGFDFYLKNGADSFNKLNGELEAFLDNK